VINWKEIETLFSIDFEPVGLRGDFEGENSLLDCARDLHVDLVSICGGGGSCGRCKVQLIKGELSALTIEEEGMLTAEEIQEGFRLACMAYPQSNVKLHVPADSLTAPQRTQVEGLDVDVDVVPVVEGIDLELSKPSLENLQTDVENLWEALAGHGFDPPGAVDLKVLQGLSPLLREQDWQVNVALRGGEIVGVGKPGTCWLGLAVDIGTTKVAGYLVELQTGKLLASKGVMNPQISYGEDVVARIVTAGKSAKDADRLQALLVEALNQMAAEMCAETGNDPAHIVEVVAVGNTAIHHLFLRLPVEQLGLAPYVPVVDTALDIKAREIGLEFGQGAYLHLLPNIAGYVGADHVAMLLATRMDEAKKTTLAIDIGTNTEICLNYRGRMTSVSCASGPAFEGAHIKFGMRAAPGAIEHARFNQGKLEIQTIAGDAPVGICGSGLLDIVAQLRLNEIVNQRGGMVEHPLVEERDEMREFLLAEREGNQPVTITQKDIRELQLAKAAIRLGIIALVEAEGITEDDLDEIMIAGAFGTFIDVGSAITIGMLPDLPLERFEQVGNAAGTGARLALISKEERERAIEIARRDAYIELAKIPDFNRKYANATLL
jgi:uncharacterized 2Fe-2S/4Fe-4S cluster protein (DUF4445 family)